MDGKYTQKPTKEEWAGKYNLKILDSIVKNIEQGNVSVWSEEILHICKGGGKSVLEIGCGTGMSSLWLAKHGHKVTALDYTEESIQLVRASAERLNVTVDTVVADAVKELPFKEKTFDYAFQCGLLEHFSRKQQIDMLRNWSKYCRNMISMIPNAASIPYRIGKKIMEENGTWEYGLEVPRHSLAAEFLEAGIEDIREYTIGAEWAMSFLPKRHYILKIFKRLMHDGYKLEDYMQGYLLVTIGTCK